MSPQSCLSNLCRGSLRMQSSQSSRPERVASLLFIGVTVVFQFRVFGVAVTFGLMVLLSQDQVLTALPLWRHPWQEAAVLLLPTVILILAVCDFEASLA